MTAVPFTVPFDVRPARGRHRTRPNLAGLLTCWRAARIEFAIGAASVGALAAAVLS